MEDRKQDQLEEELHEYQKEKEKIRDIVDQLGGKNKKQNKIISGIFLILIVGLLIAGLGLKKMDLQMTLLIALMVGVFKLIWMIYEAQKTNHFQFWILSSLEFRINEVDKKIRKMEKIMEEDKKNMGNDKSLMA